MGVSNYYFIYLRYNIKNYFGIFYRRVWKFVCNSRGLRWPRELCEKASSSGSQKLKKIMMICDNGG